MKEFFSLLGILRKAILLSTLILAYILVSLFWRVWARDLISRRRYFTSSVSFFTGLALKLLNIKTNIINLPDQHKSYLLVGNHLGFLDIFVLASNFPCLFVTSVEMRAAFGLGFLTEMAGCLYVERRNRSRLTEDIEKIRHALKQNFSVALYPEGTSSNGEKVLVFKKSLLAAAAGSNVPILPMVINYRKVNGELMSHKWRDYVCWYGAQTFPEVALRILSMQSTEVDLEFLPEAHVHSVEQRGEMAEKIHQAIVEKYAKIPIS